MEAEWLRSNMGLETHFDETFDPLLLISRAEVYELAEGSDGIRFAEWELAIFAILPKNSDF
jgi:hypothetical protein